MDRNEKLMELLIKKKRIEGEIDDLIQEELSEIDTAVIG